MSNVSKQMSQLQQTVSVQWLPPSAASGSDTITLTRRGNIVTVAGAYQTHASSDLGDTPHQMGERLPVGYRPRDYAYIISGNTSWVIGYDPTDQSLNARGNTQGRRLVMTGTWFTDDPFPV